MELTRPVQPDARSLRTYLIVLARHRAVDLLRSELRRVARQADTAGWPQQPVLAPATR